MHKMKIAEIYTKIVPYPIRKLIAPVHAKKVHKATLQDIKNGKFCKDNPNECAYMLAKNEVFIFPYKWAEKYNSMPIDVYRDNSVNMRFVVTQNGKRLYFPKKYSKERIQSYYRGLLVEQDFHSPHYYFDPQSAELHNGILFDVGGAEGFISLSVVDNVSEVYIFECDDNWIEPLRKTFEDYDKVHIINKYVSDNNDENCVTIDKIAGSRKNIILKIDVEGMEKNVLDGATLTLKKPDTRIYVCTYHKPDDEEILSNYLHKFGYTIEQSEGFMFIGVGRKHKESFRKGLIRAYKA